MGGQVSLSAKSDQDLKIKVMTVLSPSILQLEMKVKGSFKRDLKTDAPCHGRCGMLKTFPAHCMPRALRVGFLLMDLLAIGFIWDWIYWGLDEIG